MNFSWYQNIVFQYHLCDYCSIHNLNVCLHQILVNKYSVEVLTFKILFVMHILIQEQCCEVDHANILSLLIFWISPSYDIPYSRKYSHGRIQLLKLFGGEKFDEWPNNGKWVS